MPAQVLNQPVGDAFNPGEQESDTSWGFADTAFAADSQGIVRMSGTRYEFCGVDLPDLLPFAAR
ncbi:MAG TPA: hypothetical protein VL137_08065, partial [Polyangiaceae bacterium]|nr:hypothetical protein [Polyangiaceae bacterium]